MLLNDEQIMERCLTEGMITPFCEQTRFNGERKVVSYGLSSAGYDIRVSNKFKIPTDDSTFDPHDLDACKYEDFEAPFYILEPHQMVLAQSVEYFDIPKDIMSICLGKSTYARGALFVNVTPLEPGWKGILTIELSNTGHIPIVIYPDEGIAQLLFLKIDPPHTTYADKGGKYQGQTGITTARL